jgi:hypothetical protein
MSHSLVNFFEPALFQLSLYVWQRSRKEKGEKESVDYDTSTTGVPADRV